jgi:hypothetical protein
MQWIDLTGTRFGRLTAVRYLGNSKWECVCNCGREHKADAYHLRSGMIQSCGCFRREVIDRNNSERSKRAIDNTVARFWQSVDKSGECWVWISHTFRDGYGKFKGPGPEHKTFQSHRFVYALEVGEIPKGMFVCHHCDNPPCVNPKHLFLGTALDNKRDCIAKGRANFQRKRAASNEVAS